MWRVLTGIALRQPLSGGLAIQDPAGKTSTRTGPGESGGQGGSQVKRGAGGRAVHPGSAQQIHFFLLGHGFTIQTRRISRISPGVLTRFLPFFGRWVTKISVLEPLRIFRFSKPVETVMRLFLG